MLCRGNIVCVATWTMKGTTRCEPFMSMEHACKTCGETDHFCPYIDPSKNADRSWHCGNDECPTWKAANHLKATNVPATPFRALQWPSFCEINGLGDLDHDVKFEEIAQSDGKISYLLKFAKTPKGIILMQGASGTGKTYASLGLCELFTRTSTSCIFLTQSDMTEKWLETFNKTGHNNFDERLINCELLVVDDFAAMEPPEKFMGFFMKIIDKRLKWSNKGTVISTNLNDEKLSEYCGSHLMDRLRTGQTFKFEDKSRRQKVVL